MRSPLLFLVAACGRVAFDDVVRPGDAGADTAADAAADAAKLCSAVTTTDWMASPMPTDADKKYTVSQDGMVVFDLVTGLTWEHTPSTTLVDLAGATAYCGTLTIGGCMHWRLPQRVELASIIDHTFQSPVVNQGVFPSTAIDTPYWTTTVEAGSPLNRWVINFDNGNTFFQSPQTYHVWCVSDGGTGTLPPTRYELGTSFVTDHQTGLVWVRNVDVTTYSQTAGIAQCANAGLRLPEIQELETIIDSSRMSPSIDPTAFPGAPPAVFWSSSAFGPNAGMVIDFSNGNIVNALPTTTYQIRCVM